MQACAVHVEYQLPNEHTRVGYVLDAIENTHAPLLAAMANIEEDTATNPPGKRNHFENAVAYLLPKDPVVKQRSESGSKRPQAQISDATATGFGAKAGMGKTGVHLRWYKKPEYAKLNEAQKAELWQWRQDQDQKPGATRKDGDTRGQSRAAKRKKAVAAAVEKKVIEVLESKSKDQGQNVVADDENIRTFIMSLMKQNSSTENAEASAVGARPPSEAARAQARVTLQSILSRSKNG